MCAYRPPRSYTRFPINLSDFPGGAIFPFIKYNLLTLCIHFYTSPRVCVFVIYSSRKRVDKQSGKMHANRAILILKCERMKNSNFCEMIQPVRICRKYILFQASAIKMNDVIMSSIKIRFFFNLPYHHRY